jgi:hypothetical protein
VGSAGQARSRKGGLRLASTRTVAKSVCLSTVVTKILLDHSSQITMDAALLSQPTPRTAFECESSKGKAIICDVLNNSKEAKSVLITTHGAGGSHTAAAMTHWQEGSSQSLPSELKTLLPRRSAHMPCQ